MIIHDKGLICIENIHDAKRLKELQSLPLNRKIGITQARIIEWYQRFNGNVYVSFSGGKDSTVLLDIARKLFPDIPAVFINTGLEFPEIRRFASSYPGVTVLKPKMSFVDVIMKYGYPLIGKEVAEAVYYARRIIPYNTDTVAEGGGQRRTNRESIIKRSELLNCYQGTRDSTINYLCKLCTPPAKIQRTCSKTHGVYGSTKARDTDTAEPSASTSSDSGRARPPRQRRLELLGKRPMSRLAPPPPWRKYRQQLLGVYIASKKYLDALPSRYSAEPLGSRFNKEKWLLLARELPVKIGHQCCHVMKKSPSKTYERVSGNHVILGSMAEESRIRRQAWIKNGCNAFDASRPNSNPMSFWTENDVLEYIDTFKLPYCEVYGDIENPCAAKEKSCYKCTGVDRTGCIFCAFGAHSDGRFLKIAQTHPKQYEYCMKGGQWIDNPDYDPNAPMEPDAMGWINWNPKKIWAPSKDGLGMQNVFQMTNDLYGYEVFKYQPI